MTTTDRAHLRHSYKGMVMIRLYNCNMQCIRMPKVKKHNAGMFITDMPEDQRGTWSLDNRSMCDPHPGSGAAEPLVRKRIRQ